MIIPPALRAISSPHRDALIQFFGSVDPVTGWAPPQVEFLFLCFTNRCGSNYLAHLLGTTGAFNAAGEFFNAETVLEHAVPRGLASLQAYFSVLPDLVPHRGRIAAKAGVDQLVMLADAGILDALGARARYLLLERQDRLAQAISRVIASQTGQWFAAQPAQAAERKVRYERAAIMREMDKIAHANAAFYAFFRANGIVPLHTSYEEVLADPQRIVEATGAAFGMSWLRGHPEHIALTRQANEVNATWRTMYLSGK